MRPVQLHLVRHGQSTWNVEGRLQGQTAHPDLTDLGHEQARTAAATLAARIDGSVEVLTSDLQRARSTADRIASTLGVEATNDPDLREQALGHLEGRLTADLQPEPTPDGQHVSEVAWGGGESLRDVHERLAAPIQRARDTAYEHVVWVTHGDTMRVALARLAGRTHREVAWDPIPNGAIVTVELDRP
ncbi:histidine phosphatase family protein [Knoellia subterranea]|uniref:Phosphoglycerate kinase n=1 Tax=Knoellia subterranea KCTC 19937 TaxID=1385521 RepID=A0A0A0JMF6_9MICO|nr:histidine phosphatase family protein [Knoellia subterranea]KGN36816.1 phosphoglycerate kinase [Knoellia subterranea KCTC 19937]